MILFLKRINILLAFILLSLALGIVKFKNNLPDQNISNFNVDAIVVLTGGKGERIPTKIAPAIILPVGISVGLIGVLSKAVVSLLV